ncbi:MAG TPA: hypothetical protein VM821_05275 [Abditibacteriaceae bacterium]|nr:hypothetical protein [Abditibacteriaceae bacterium]
MAQRLLCKSSTCESSTRLRFICRTSAPYLSSAAHGSRAFLFGWLHEAIVANQLRISLQWCSTKHGLQTNHQVLN